MIKGFIMIITMKKNLNIFLFLCFAFLIITSCKQDSSASSALAGASDQLLKLEAAYNIAPSVTTANTLLKEVMNSIGTQKLDKATQKQYMEYGLKVSNEQNVITKKAGFLMALIKDDYGNADTAKRIYELADIMRKMRKATVSNTLAKGLLNAFPNFTNADKAKALLSEDIPNLEDYIAGIGKSIFENPDNTGINRNASLAYVDACEAYALVNPQSETSPSLLFKAAEVAKSLRTFPKSLTLYDWVIEKYPNYEKAGTAMFLKGFIIENNLGDDVKAKEVYDAFLKKYPKHDLADDVQFLIENLGKSDEEILKMIESKQKNN